MGRLLLFLVLLLLTPLLSCGEDDTLYSTICQQPCYTGDISTAGVGECRYGRPICENREFLSCGGEVLPEDEFCDGLDNDCNGKVDDYVLDEEYALSCGITIGECSYGYYDCIEGEISCYGGAGPGEEVCDGVDNDCNGFVDDLEILGLCYEGDWEQVGHGECRAGIYICENAEVICERQQLPKEEICDGLDNDCDGFIDEELNEGDEVDIVFVLDRSGSMNEHFPSVANAARLFATSFTGMPAFKFALIGIPHTPGTQEVEVLLNFTDAAAFVTTLGTMTTTGGGEEASYDAPYKAANGDLGLSWREGEVRKYIVLFTDENAQSYVNPALTEEDVAAKLVEKDITFYGFIRWAYHGQFDDIAIDTGGDLYHLGSATQMESDLGEIFDDECW